MNIEINDSVTSNLLNLINETHYNSSKSINILNISCDVSKIYNSLISKFKDCNIINIEMDTVYKYNLDSVPNTTLGNVHGLDNIYDKDYFDLIILDDSIQRFVDPWKIFTLLNSYIKEDGYLFASIPNIMHVNALINIIGGRFEYSNSGPLNKDNLRFFTLNEIRKLFDSTGYDLFEISSVSSEVNTQSQAFIDIIYPNASSDVVAQFHCYQYTLKSRPKSKAVKTLYDYVYNS